MAKHDVYATLANALLGKKDAYFDIYEDGRKLGTITISKGSIEWYPKMRSNHIKCHGQNLTRWLKDGMKDKGSFIHFNKWIFRMPF